MKSILIEGNQEAVKKLEQILLRAGIVPTTFETVNKKIRVYL